MFIGKQLKCAREKKGLTQKKLGDLLGLSSRTISYYETGAKNPTVKYIKEICGILDISSDELLDIPTNWPDGRSLDGKLLERFRQLQDLSPSKKKAAIQFIDAMLEKDK